MKVILFAAISVNGMIAEKSDNTNWISKEEWDCYSLEVRNAGCLIVGRRTYNILTKQPEFAEFKDVKLVVVSKQDFPLLSPNHSIANSPQEALKFLNNYENIIVAGGGILNASFLAENLVDEIYLDIEPVIIGDGIPVFRNKDFLHNLELLEQKAISENEIQLHYKIIK
jgi:dihydrofolate reductase